jgi:hypothetical protein
MSSINRLPRRLTAFFAVTLAVLLGATLTAVPAQAAYGPAQPIYIQLQRTSSSGYTTQVGRLIGTLRFDDGNSLYRLDVTLCRQSSYVDTILSIRVNNTLQQRFSQRDEILRPDVCGGHGISGVINADFAYSGPIYNIGIGYEGILFDGSTATSVGGGAFYDNPFN